MVKFCSFRNYSYNHSLVSVYWGVEDMKSTSSPHRLWSDLTSFWAMTHSSFFMSTVVYWTDLAFDNINTSIHQIDCGVITGSNVVVFSLTEQMGDAEAVNTLFVPDTLFSRMPSGATDDGPK